MGGERNRVWEAKRDGKCLVGKVRVEERKHSRVRSEDGKTGGRAEKRENTREGQECEEHTHTYREPRQHSLSF